MTEEMNSLSEQLDQICRLSGAKWAVWMQYEREEWKIILSGRLNKARQNALQEFVHGRSTNAWLSGSLQSGRARSRSTGVYSQQLGCLKVFTFTDKPSQSVLLIGADGLTSDHLAFFHIFSKNGVFAAREKHDHLTKASDSVELEELDNFNQQESSLIELAATTVGVQDTAQVINLVIQKLAEIFKTDRVSVFLLDTDLQNFHESFNEPHPSHLRTPEESNLAAYIIETGALVRLNSVTELSRLNYHSLGIQSALAAPLKTPTKTIGALLVESEEPQFFNIHDEYLMMMVANQVVGILINLDAYQETQARSRNLELIHQVIKNIVGLTDETEVAQRTADLMAEYFGYEFTVIMMADETAQNLKIVGIGGTKADLIKKGTKFSITKGIIGRVFRTGESYFSNDISDDPDYFSILSWRAGSEICAPLRERDQIIGVINLERSEKGFFTEMDLIVTESLAGILSSVLMNAHRYKQINNKVNQLEAVRATSLDLSADLDLDLLFKQVVHRVRDLVNANGAEIGLVEEENHGIRVQTSDNPWYDFTGHLIPIGKGIAGKVLQSGGPIRVKDYFSWSDRLWPGTKVEFKAAAGVPLKLKGKVIGTLVVMDDKEGREFSIEDINTLQMIAQNISLAIHNAQLYKDLNESIEAQRQTENMLVQSERMAAAGRLTATIAHEINNPLQALQNCLYLADHAELGSKTRQKYITMARAELERLNTTVQRMLDYYRPGARDRQLTDINELIGRIIDLVNPQMKKNGVVVETHLDPEIPGIMAVSNQIQQVLLNLILNAMEAMPDGGKIYLTTKPCDELIPGGRRGRKPRKPVGVEIFIQDTGPGVSLENKEQIFEPFVSTKKNGIGLGLSVSYGIIQAHGGTLNLMSDDNPGACFRIALPLEVEQ